MKTGRHLSVPSHYYHAEAALGSTDIRIAAAKSVAHAMVQADRPSSSAMLRGSMVHGAVLEPNTFDLDFVAPKVSQCQTTLKNGKRCSKKAHPGATTCWAHGGREEAEVWEEGLPSGCTVVTQDQMADALAVADGIRAGVARLEPPYNTILERGDREVTYRVKAQIMNEWPGYRLTTDGDGIDVHCRVDIDLIEARRLMDLKGIGEDMPNPHGFARRMANYGMHVQAALYVDAVKACEGVDCEWSWLAHESNKPYAVRIYDADPSDLDAGRELVGIGLKRWTEYIANGNQWYGWPDKPCHVLLPAWAVEGGDND